MAASFSIFENDVLSLYFDVQAPQYVGDEFLYVLMAAVGEGDASALSVGRRRRGGDDPFRIDDDGLIVRLRELHECHERPCLWGAVSALAAFRNLRRAGITVKPVPKM